MASSNPSTTTSCPSLWQVLSAETRFSADKGLAAEMSAADGFLAEKKRN